MLKSLTPQECQEIKLALEELIVLRKEDLSQYEKDIPLWIKQLLMTTLSKDEIITGIIYLHKVPSYNKLLGYNDLLNAIEKAGGEIINIDSVKKYLNKIFYQNKVLLDRLSVAITESKFLSLSDQQRGWKFLDDKMKEFYQKKELESELKNIEIQSCKIAKFYIDREEFKNTIEDCLQEVAEELPHLPITTAVRTQVTKKLMQKLFSKELPESFGKKKERFNISK